jgi:hypothetical protein
LPFKQGNDYMTRYFLLGLAILGVFAFTPTESKADALLNTSVPVFADTLAVGSMYFDSEQTFQEVINLSVQHDNEGIARLIQNGHISDLTREEKDILVLKNGATPESLAEFRFLTGQTTFWTSTKNITAKPVPRPTQTPTPESTPLPAESPIPTSKQHSRQTENNPPFDDDNAKRNSHQVDGKWKRYPAKKHRVTTLPSSGPRPTPTPLIMNEGNNLYNSDLTQPFKNYRKPVGQ